MSYDPQITRRLYQIAGPAIGIIVLLTGIGAWLVGIIDDFVMGTAAVLCAMFVATPLVQRLPRLAGPYAAFLLTALHGLAVYVGVTGAGLLSPAVYFSIVLPILGAVFLGRAVGILNVAVCALYAVSGVVKYLYFPSAIEAELTLGVAIVTAVAMLSALALGFAISLLFISQSRRAAEQLEQARAEISEALNNMSNGLVMVSPDGSIRLYNDRVLDMFGLAPGQLFVGMQLNQYLGHIGVRLGWSAERLQRAIDSHAAWMQKDTTTRLEHRFEDGTIFAVACRPMPDGGAVLTYEDVTEVRHGQEKIAHMAFHDALTGLPNRRSFADHVTELCRRGGFAMLMLDLDRFKSVNDTLGHAVGDRLLVEVAQRMRDVCGPQDLLFRLGGDEFAILTELSEDDAQALGADIVNALARPFRVDDHTLAIGGSVGFTTAARGDDPDLLQRMADLALYRAKENGRGRVEAYRDGMIEEAEHRRRLESDLSVALATGQFELHYQPLYDLPGRILCGFEALIRWHHPERGLIPPDEFIPLAEQNGSIVEIGAWVIEEACRQAALWPSDIYVSINVSPVQLRSTEILHQITAALDRHRITPRRIEVEVTETAMVEDSQQIAVALAGLRALGVRIAMDDFGTGYSSLAHLREFELDRIKIDRSFIAASQTDASSAAVVRAVTSMARDLAISTTGEGIESQEQLDSLIALGCETAQGYLLGRPLDARGATALIGRGDELATSSA